MLGTVPGQCLWAALLMPQALSPHPAPSSWMGLIRAHIRGPGCTPFYSWRLAFALRHACAARACADLEPELPRFPQPSDNSPAGVP